MPRVIEKILCPFCKEVAATKDDEAPTGFYRADVLGSVKFRGNVLVVTCWGCRRSWDALIAHPARDKTNASAD